MITETELPALLEACAIAKMVIDSAEGRAKRLLAKDPDSVPGWGLSENNGQRRISDPSKAFEAVHSIIDANQFATCCSVKISALEILIRHTLGVTTKVAKEWIGEHLGSVIEMKEKAPSLMRKKPAHE